MVKFDIEENYDELRNLYKILKIDVLMIFEYFYIFLKFRFFILIIIINIYICMKFVKCDGWVDGYMDRYEDRYD